MEAAEKDIKKGIDELAQGFIAEGESKGVQKCTDILSEKVKNNKTQIEELKVTLAEQKATLFKELGELTYQRAKLQAELNKNAQRSNEIGTLLEKAEKDG